MNFQELYYQNPYQTTFEAEVLTCTPGPDSNTYYLTLSQTLFYPEGGGQPADRGTLTVLPDCPETYAQRQPSSCPKTSAQNPSDNCTRTSAQRQPTSCPEDSAQNQCSGCPEDSAQNQCSGCPENASKVLCSSCPDRATSSEPLSVLDVQDSDRGVLHVTAKPLSTGTRVRGEIDWSFRFPLMQNHTGEHIISGLVHRKYGYENVGFHMSDVITLDLSGPLTWDEAMEIERQANEVVYADLPVDVFYPDDTALETIDYRSKKELEGAVRIIHIDDADDCACCGLHVRHTGEVGLIKLLSLMNHRGGVRITMLSGRQALRYFEQINDASTAVGQLLSVKPHETLDAVQHMLQESLNKDRKIADINQRYFQAKADSFTEKKDLILCFEEQMNQVELRKFCDLLVKSGKGAVCAVLTETEPDTWQYCIGSTEVDLRAAVKVLNEQLNGRGGGKSVMVQGTFHANAVEIEAALRQILL